MKTQIGITLVSLSLLAACGADEGGIHEGRGDDGYTGTETYEGGNNGSYGDIGSEGGGGESREGGEAGEPVEIDPGQLTAGRWIDHDNWSFWLKLMSPEETRGFRDIVTGWGLHPFERVAVHVASDGLPAGDQVVELHDGESQVLWSARTDSAGNAFLFPAFHGGTTPSDLLVTVDDITRQLTDEDDAIAIDLPGAEQPSEVLDVLFTIDVTGSMMDEQYYLQSEMRDVMERLADARPDLSIRASFNFYCDPNDSFVVKSNAFGSVEDALADLARGAACGGGDYEEAVDEGLEDALAHEWSSSARARIVFLVLDAPPHSDDDGIQRLSNFASEAAEKGIKLVPIVSSGANHSLEFLMRSLVLATNGTYTFLTAHSGIGGEKLEPTIGQYEVELLNELMLDLLLTETADPTTPVATE